MDDKDTRSKHSDGQTSVRVADGGETARPEKSRSSWPFGETGGRLRAVVDNYGSGLLFAATIFGAGSTYILASSGAQFGYSLLFMLPLAGIVDLGMREMAGRLGTINKPLMEYIRDTIGAGPSKALAVFIAFIMHFWAISNYAVAGAMIAYLTPLDNVYIGVILAAGVGIAFLELRVYERVELAIALMVSTIFGIYLVLMFDLNLPMQQVAAGLLPTLRSTDISYLALLIGILGTTVYYPNFFIQSSLQAEKGWTDMSKYRRDNVVGIVFVVTLSIAVMAVTAATLDPGPTTLVGPGQPLSRLLGGYALTAFAIATLLAAFSSATGTLFGAGYLVPQAWGRKTVFGDPAFRRVVEVLIVMSVCFIIPLLEFTAFTPVRLGITMPAINGVIGLPITALALFFANEKFFEHPLWMRVGFAIVVVVMFALALLTAQDLYSQIIEWL
jgi:manganese transport protein